MIDGLKPYPAMKDSGVPWLGEVPAGWAVVRGKGLFRCIDERSARGAEELLTVSSERGVVPRRTAKVTMFKAESYQGYKLCWPGDLVINSLWAWGRGLGVSPHHGIVSSAYGVYRAKGGLAVPRYIHELVRSQPFNWELQVRSKGIWISRLQLTDDSFLDAPFLLPPLTEQHLIVRFLDHADRRIRRLIAAKQRMIKLLEEQKRAIIHQAVTRGLDPNVKMKASGVSWLGEVPEHWQTRKIRQCARVEGGLTPSMENRNLWDGGVPWVTPKDMKRWAVGESLLTVSPRALTETSLRLISSPAVLLVVRGMILARTIPIAVTVAPVTINQDMKALVPAGPVSAQFLGLALLGAREALTALIDEAGHGTKRLPTERWRELELPVPPPAEQTVIVSYIEEQSRVLGAVSAAAGDEITLLREYRTRLIADVVTGKLDVREAAALLPEESASPDPGGLDDELSDDLDPSDEPTPDDPEP